VCRPGPGTHGLQEIRPAKIKTVGGFAAAHGLVSNQDTYLNHQQAHYGPGKQQHRGLYVPSYVLAQV
jgi:hypothetical protein